MNQRREGTELITNCQPRAEWRKSGQRVDDEWRNNESRLRAYFVKNNEVTINNNGLKGSPGYV
jgi:hypothetical protein